MYPSVNERKEINVFFAPAIKRTECLNPSRLENNADRKVQPDARWKQPCDRNEV